MRWITVTALLVLTSQAIADETVQMSKQAYFDQHVTAEDRGDHYLLHFNVAVRLDEAPGEVETRLLHASVLFSRGDTISDVSLQRRSVRLTDQNEIWSFYFRVPKFNETPSETVYAVVANVDGVEREAAAAWRFAGGELNMGSADQPIFLYYPVGRAVEEDDGRGGFRLVVRYEVKTFYNNYEALPTVGFLEPNKTMPESVDGPRSAKRVAP